jgi:biopolymer transport protein ExbD
MAFFILTFRPVPTEGQLALVLPSLGEGAPAPIVQPDEKPDAYIVTVAPTGGIPSDISLQKDGELEPVTFRMTPQSQSKAMDDLYAALAKIVKDQKVAKRPTPTLDMQFADEVRYQYVIKMLDDAKVAGFEKITPNLLGSKPKKKPAP